MELVIIGFTQKAAEYFFSSLQKYNITYLLDIRRRPKCQLSAFAKQRYLPYFLDKLLNVKYEHKEHLAPSDEILTIYRKDKNWKRFAKKYRSQIVEQDVINKLDRAIFDNNRVVLLCSEHSPDKCHRRLMVEYLENKWKSMEVQHIV